MRRYFFFIVLVLPNLLWAETTLWLFQPFVKGKLDTSFKVTGQMTGRCEHGSLTTPRKDAFRCFVANNIYDPCFQNPAIKSDKTKILACFLDPWAKQATLIKTAAPDRSLNQNRLDDKTPISFSQLDYFPWGIQLSDGTRCTLHPGKVPLIGPLSIRYSCEDGSMILGKLRRNEENGFVSHMNSEQFEIYNKTGRVNTTTFFVRDAWY